MAKRGRPKTNPDGVPATRRRKRPSETKPPEIDNTNAARYDERPDVGQPPKKTTNTERRGRGQLGKGEYMRPKRRKIDENGVPDYNDTTGRRLVFIDWDKVDKMLAAGVSGTTIAQTLGISKETLYRRCEDEKRVGFGHYRQQQRARGLDMLKAKQHDLAMRGDRGMLIWLGKNYLGQTENGSVETDGANNDFGGFEYVPVETENDANDNDANDNGEG